jgi:tight adherence protein B
MTRFCKSAAKAMSIKGRIGQAGLSISEPIFWSASVGVAMVAGGGVMLVGAPFFIAGAVAAIVGLGVPRWVLGMLIGMRQKKFVLQLSDALDVIVRGVKSGLPLGQCMQIIARESPSPLKEEFQRLVDGQAVGAPLETNLQRMYERMPLPEVNFFNIVLLIQAKAGGNLSEALGNLSTVLRARRMLGEKIKALSAEAKMSAMIIGAMPFVVATILMFVRPDYIPILFTTETGHIVLLVCALMLTAGILVMRNMINFKY